MAMYELTYHRNFSASTRTVTLLVASPTGVDPRIGLLFHRVDLQGPVRHDLLPQVVWKLPTASLPMDLLDGVSRYGTLQLQRFPSYGRHFRY